MRLIFKSLTLLYFALVFYITFLARRRRGLIDFRARANLKILDKFKIFGRWEDLPPHAKVSYGQDIFGNIFMFMPLIPALYILLGRELSCRWSILIIIGVSSCIETGQYIFNRGVFDLDDILLNTIGGIFGLAIWKLVSKNKK